MNSTTHTTNGLGSDAVLRKRLISLTTLLLTSSLSTMKTWDWSSGMEVARGKLKLSPVEPTSEVPADFYNIRRETWNKTNELLLRMNSNTQHYTVAAEAAGEISLMDGLDSTLTKVLVVFEEYL